jgi:hypothetical protein
MSGLVKDRVLVPLGMCHSRLDEPEPGFHGFRPLMTTAEDYGRFLAHVLAIRDLRWEPLWRIDDELAWGAGWGLELGPPLYGWQWGSHDDASNFVIGCPATSDGVVVLTDDPDGCSYYRSVVEKKRPGDHASLRVEQKPPLARAIRLTPPLGCAQFAQTPGWQCARRTDRRLWAAVAPSERRQRTTRREIGRSVRPISVVGGPGRYPSAGRQVRPSIVMWALSTLSPAQLVTLAHASASKLRELLGGKCTL